MKKDDFDKLVTSVKQAGRIKLGKARALGVRRISEEELEQLLGG